MKTEEKHLNKLIKEDTFVNIYTDRYDESYLGFIVEFNDEFLIFEEYNDDSNPDGITVFFRENITRIRWSGNEINSIYKLIDNSTRLNKKVEIDISSTESILKTISEFYGYVTIHTQDIDSGVCFIGEITEMDNETLILNEFGTRISLDRKFIMVSLPDITLIEGGGKYEENLKRLLK
ncbi:hypothetical protein [Lacinutrix undariae]